jgi:hypothetical protein
MDGGVSLEGAKKIEEAMKAREAAKDAARLKDMTAAQRQWELESRIMRALNEEKAAIAKGDEERAKKAQAIQEETLRKLIADPITPDYIVEKYRKMVTAIEAAPGPEVKIKINWEDFLGLPAKLQDAIQAPGSGYTIDMTVRVHPELVGGNYILDQKAIDSGSDTPLTDAIDSASDAVGANP